MKLMQGDVLSQLSVADHVLVCTASNLNSASELPMLNGAAGVLALKYPSLPKEVGKWILENHGDASVYGLRCASKVGLFQNMIFPRQGPNLAVISFAGRLLRELAEANPDKTYAVEAPNYNDPWFMVQGIMELLPDNVSVWKP